MVLDNVTDHTLFVGVPFRYGFATGKVIDGPRAEGEDPRILMSMEIFHPSGSKTTLEYGHGLMEGYRLSDSTATVAFSIFDPAYIGVGEHKYTLIATEPDGTPILIVNGTLTVSDDVPAVEDLPPAPVWDLLTPKQATVPAGISDWRLSICAGCPALDAATQICTECGCYMPVKATLATATCPLNKWITDNNPV